MSLKNQIVNDLDVFFSDFGDEWQYIPVAGPSRSISVIFDSKAEIVQDNIITEAPVIQVKTADIEGLTDQDQFVDGTVIYNILKPFPDEHGMRNIALTQD